MTEDYILDVSEQFSPDHAQFNRGKPDVGIKSERTDEELAEKFFRGAMQEMTRYLFERFRDLVGSVSDYMTPENTENIYITQYPFEPTVVVVEFEELPDGFTMEDADLREFCWRPHPAHARKTTGAYFQPREA